MGQLVADTLLTVKNEKPKPGEELRGAKRVKMKKGPRDEPWVKLTQVEGKMQVRERASEWWKENQEHPGVSSFEKELNAAKRFKRKRLGFP